MVRPYFVGLVLGVDRHADYRKIQPQRKGSKRMANFFVKQNSKEQQTAHAVRQRPIGVKLGE